MTQEQANAIAAGASTFILITVVISLALTVLIIVAYWRIFAKTGHNGALSLLLLVPIANIVIILYLAFSEWPIYRELNALRQQAAMRGPQYPPYPQGQPYQQPSQYPPNPPYPNS